MKKERIKIEDFIEEELEKEAEDIRKKIDTLPDNEGMSKETKENIYGNLKEQIAEYELEKRYPDMSEEDRRALRLGYELLRREKEEAVAGETESVKRVVRRRKRVRFYLGLAAVLVFVCAVGVTSMGGPARIVTFLKGMVGDREVMKVNSSEDNLVIVEENEEEAYELIEEEFGVKPVKIMAGLKEKQFQFMELDKSLESAELTYSYNEKKLTYCISALYRPSSLGIDVEDKIISEYEIEKKDCVINIKEYEIAQSKTRRYSANFKYKGIEYFLFGTIEQEDFEEILKNLYFFH